MLELMTENVVLSAVDTVTYVVLSKKKKTRVLWRISWYH